MGKQKYFINPGEQYGLWTVVEKSQDKPREKWLCKCQCGNEKSVNKSHLYSGASQSCGCVGAAKITERNTKHNKTSTKEYSTWGLIKNRCHNPKSEDFKDYGEKGILVCEGWLESFQKFYDDMGPSPSDGQKWSIGRIDNSKGYCPENCRWETDTQQARNKTMKVTNTSGKTGVMERVRDGRISFVAKWIDLQGKIHTKEFSAKKYGYNTARKLAENARDTAITNLNAQGAGYSENHGK